VKHVKRKVEELVIMWSQEISPIREELEKLQSELTALKTRWLEKTEDLQHEQEQTSGRLEDVKGVCSIGQGSRNFGRQCKATEDEVKKK
jgi:uncharacterized protein (DUF342 family)